MSEVRCEECGWVGRFRDALQGVNPFDAEEPVFGCPKCRCINPFVSLCDEPGCLKEVSCGFPVYGEMRYRNTCGDHYRAAQAAGEIAPSGWKIVL